MPARPTREAQTAANAQPKREGSRSEQTPSQRKRGRDSGRRLDHGLTDLARGGLINLASAITNGLFGFALVVVVTRGLGAAQAGPFFLAVALFSILSNTLELGADTGLVRMIARYLVLGRVRDIRPTITIALVPVLAVGSIFGVCLFVFARPITDLLARNTNPSELLPYLRIFAVFLPFDAASTVLLSATRGFGTMLPFALIENISKPGLRPLAATVVVIAGLGATAMAFAWGAPIALAFGAAFLCVRRLLKRSELAMEPQSAEAAVPGRSLARAFWRFSAPRAFAAVFAITITWLDTLLLGALKGATQAGIYTAASRYMLAGSFALQAVILVISPQISASLAKGDRQRAAFLYNSATCWLVIPSFPIYLTMAVFAPFLLELFGRGFERGESVLVILALATLVNMATGPVQAVLLMSGRSLWNLANTGAAVLINIVLNLVLIPRMGIDGAAIAWAAVIILNNVATLLEVMFFMKLRPFSRPLLLLVGASGFCFGLGGVAVRELFGLSVGSFLGFIAVAGLLYTGFLFANRRELRLAELGDALRRRMGSPPSESAPV